MPKFGPMRRRDFFIRYLRKLGFEGPYSGGKHQYMVRDKMRLVLPNPHRGDIGRELLNKILAQAGVSRTTWERL